VALFKSSNQIQVVGGAILDLKAGKLLAARRRYPITLASGWELPGGKVEAGETHQQALKRELQEELDITVEVGERVPGEWRINDRITMRVFTATITRGTPHNREHAQIRWLAPSQWNDVRWLVNDVEAVKKSMAILSKKLGK
jgi:8-oxo-dGTP diphosphatase